MRNVRSLPIPPVELGDEVKVLYDKTKTQGRVTATLPKEVQITTSAGDSLWFNRAFVRRLGA